MLVLELGTSLRGKNLLGNGEEISGLEPPGGSKVSLMAKSGSGQGRPAPPLQPPLALPLGSLAPAGGPRDGWGLQDRGIGEPNPSLIALLKTRLRECGIHPITAPGRF